LKSINYLNAQQEFPNMDSVKTYQANLEYKITAKLGEGAFWNHKTSELYWIDILNNKLHRYNPSTRKNRSLKTPSSIGTVAPTSKENKAIVALKDGIYLINTNDGTLELFSNVERELTENRLNDGKCDPKGRLWVGSMALSQEKGKANLYMIDKRGKAELKIAGVTISNGIVWSGDKKTMYYIDTPTAEIKAYDYDNETGAISNERIAVKVSELLGSPDGMAVDENDNLWVGMWNGNAVIQFDSKTGEVLSRVDVPAHNVTSCAFGGDNLDVLYITTASIDMTDEEKQQLPMAGSIFKVKTDVKGVKSPFFKLSL